MSQVTIVIPNYNGKHFMEECLVSLKEQTFQDFDIVVVDNASTDGSVEFMEENYPDIPLIINEENLGFSAAVNAGIRYSKAPFVLLLNNDTRSDPDFVKKMVQAIKYSPKIFSVASQMIQMYHPELLDSAGDSYTLMGWAVNRGVGRPLETHHSSEEVFSACAGAAIYRKKIFEKIGYFDESHFAYLEDIDVCYRARIYGYRNVYCPRAKVYHVGSGTSGSKYNTFKVKLAARNSVYLNYKNQPLVQLIFNMPWLLLGYGLKMLFFIKKGFGKDYLEGLKEGIRTRKQCAKVAFKMSHILNYAMIEVDMIEDTITYTKEWFKRKLFHE